MDIEQEIQDALRQAAVSTANAMMREWQATMRYQRESLFDQPVSYAAYTEVGNSPIDPDKVVEGSITQSVTDSARLLTAGDE